MENKFHFVQFVKTFDYIKDKATQCFLMQLMGEDKREIITNWFEEEGEKKGSYCPKNSKIVDLILGVKRRGIVGESDSPAKCSLSLQEVYSG